MQRTLERILVGGLFLIPLIPFVVTRSMFFPFITGKAFVFRIIVGILFAVWFLLITIDTSYLPRRSPLLIGVLTFFGIVTIADFFGVNFQRSLWSNFERMEGLVTFVYLCAYFFIAFSVLTKKKLWTAFWNTSVIVSVCVGVYALLQLLGVLSPSQGGARVDATLGNSIYLAVYMLFHIFFTLWLMYRSRSVKMLFVLYTCAVILQTVVLYYTGTRGTLLGLVGGLCLTAALVGWKGVDHPRIRKISIGFILCVVLGIAVFIGARESAFVQNNQFLSRIANTSLSGQTVQSRLVLWGSIAKDGFLERPLLGWGQDNFIIVFGKYYDPRMYVQEPWFDRAHNVFFDWLISAGILGLLAYLSLFVVSLITLWRPGTALSVPERALFTGLLSGYFVHNIFVFDNLISYIFFISFIACIESFSSAQQQTVSGNTGKQQNYLIQDVFVRRSISYTGAALLIILSYTTTIPHIVASQSLIKGLTYIGEGRDPAEAFPLFERSLQDSIGKDESRLQLSRVAFTLAQSNVSDDIKQLYLSRAYQEAQKAEQEDQNDTRPKYFLAVFEARIGNLDAAQRLFEELLAINPNRQMFLNEYGAILQIKGESEQARSVFETLVALAPENREYSMRYLANLLDAENLPDGLLFAKKTFGTTTAEFISDEYYQGTMTTYSKTLDLVGFLVLRGELFEKRDSNSYLSAISERAQVGQKKEALQLIDDAVRIDATFAKNAPALRDAVQNGGAVPVQDTITQ